jgi:cytidylate kinase
MTDSVPVIALDGPSGVGKGTICLLLASRLGWHILDSGSLYRLVALVADRLSSLDDVAQLVEIARTLDVKYVAEAGQLKVFLGAEDVTDIIRSEKIGVIASQIAVIPELRQALLERQRAYARAPGLVADGRDMGTVVFPQAALKIFFTASQDVRAKRRYKQLKDKGIDANLPQLVNELRQRDERDSSRAASPLVAAGDAVTVDTTSLSIEEVFNEVMKLVDQRFKF